MNENKQAEPVDYVVSAVLVKQIPTGVNTQNKLYAVNASNKEEAHGIVLGMLDADFPEHQLHTMCSYPIAHAAPAVAQEPVRLNDDDLTKIYMRFVGHQGLYPRLFEDIAGCVMTAMFEKSPPPAVAVNEQLLEALKKAEDAMTWEIGGEPCGLEDALYNARAAIRAAEAEKAKEHGL